MSAGPEPARPEPELADEICPERRYVAISRRDAAELGSAALAEWDAVHADCHIISARALLERDARIRLEAVEAYRRSAGCALRQVLAGLVLGAAVTGALVLVAALW